MVWTDQLRPLGPIIQHRRPPLGSHPMNWYLGRRLCDFYCIAGLQEDYREQKKVQRGTMTFTPSSSSSSPHLSPSFLATLSPHCTFFFQNCVFYRRLCDFYRRLLQELQRAKSVYKRQFEGQEKLHEEHIIHLTRFKPPCHRFQAYITPQASLFFSLSKKIYRKTVFQF